MITNNLEKKEKQPQPPFSSFLVQKKKGIIPVLGENAATRFIAAVTAAVSTNPSLNDCDYTSLLSGALLGESFKLAHSPALGQYYLVPFNDKKAGVTKAQFILGVKGWKTLALRSNQYRKIFAIPVKQGEFKGLDPLTSEPIIRFISDFETRETLPVVGYYAYYELLNGYSQSLYWTYEYALNHADRYSQAFSVNAVNTDKLSKVSYADYKLGKYPKKDEWKYSSFWYKNFDEMACGKVLKKLLSDGAPLSLEMQNAITADDHVVNLNENNTFDYNNGETLTDAVVEDVPQNDNTNAQNDLEPQTQEDKSTNQLKGKQAVKTKQTAKTNVEQDDDLVNADNPENFFFN